ncbi:MAG: NUDIX hydrolase [Saccharospirillaceae bacterium]|nr:NUDIX hydrolase [Saccharospirillaceae bacterium]MCD8531225.1 NUDIX hydrolase [Saccharospirillaceae bacterium]
MKYCSQCASEMSFTIPAGDNRPRFVCSACHTIFYQNPRIVAGTLPIHNGQVLLCRRAIEPRRGFWTLPAGFMENGESTEQAALRETWEEARAHVELQSLFSMITVPHIDQVHIFFLAVLPHAEFGAGEESLEVALFKEEDIPWQELAFPTVSQTLKRYFAEPANPLTTHVFDIRPPQAVPGNPC